MKKNLKSIGTLLAIGLLAVGARAGVVLQDNFDSYATGDLTNVSSGFWSVHSGATPMNVVADSDVSSPNALEVSQAQAQDDNAKLTNQPYGTPPGSIVGTNVLGNPVPALYASFTIKVVGLPTGGNTYFTHFLQGTTVFGGKVFVVTNGAASGSFRLAVQNNSNTGSNTIPTDLNLNTVYTVVTRYVLGTGLTTLWTNPVSEVSSSLTASDTPNRISPQAYAFRQSTSEGVIHVDNLVVGTTFADVVSGSVNPPTIVAQPQDITVFAGSSASFTNLAVGDPTLGYQWFSVTNNVTNAIPGATGLTLTLTGLTTNQTGFIFAVVTNSAGTNSTRLAQLTVSPQPIPPTIDTNILPTASTNIAGDTVTFTVVAHALPAPAYQWYFIPDTNNLVTNIVAGATSPTLTLTGVSANSAGKYFVTITNSIGYLTTNSDQAILKVIPPPSLSIAALRALEDPVTWSATNTTALYTIQGIVTTWTNLTTSGNSEFYIQDSSGGIAVFWSGAPSSTNQPPAGALVQVTGPLANFSGLLEIEPVFTNRPLQNVVVLSTGNPLPTPQPLPFDPNVVNNPAAMEMLEGSYFVASNVMLNLNTPAFVANANDPTTNLAYHVLADSSASYSITFTNDVGQTFILFVNSHTDLPGQTKPTGPVTVYGVLGQFVSTSPFIGGYEFTPSRVADIISYVHATNVVSHVKHWGDALTNSFTESALRPGETLTTYVSIGDAGGGTVSLTPITDGLPASASWSNVASGPTATAIFHFSPVAGDAGSNYVLALAVSSTSGFTGTNRWNVYVPSPAEQKMAITEFLANPTTNTSAPNFNPLHRSTDTIGIVTNDQYIEVVNLSSGTTLDYGWDLDKGSPGVNRIFDSNAGSGTPVSPSSAVVVYGGDIGELPSLPVTPATSGSLLLPTSGTGVMVLRNPSGNIIDRVVYSASDISSSGSLSRFPTIDSPFVPQAYVGTNAATAGLQYDGGSWSSAAQIPTGVNNVAISVVNNQAVLQFTAVPNQASTLWSANDLTSPFEVIFGQTFATSAGVFSVTNLPPVQFYYITTQTNRP